MNGTVLEVRDLKTSFDTLDGVVRAVDGLSFSLERGEMLGVVGESGCGKSVTALSIMGLVQTPPGRITAGSIRLNDRETVGLDEAAMCKIRGNEISMIFQEPMTSLNPVMRIGKQIAESLIKHQGLDRQSARERAIEMLELVQIPEARRRIDEYPHQLSGGMRQRVMIAIALACRPAVLIADEPTTALDVTIQAQILRLMAQLQRELGTAIILITHDLGVIAESVHRLIVMYAGRKVEEAAVDELFHNPRHPYTIGLLGSVPRVDRAVAPSHNRLAEIPGMVPSLREFIVGCRFAPRCPLASEVCRASDPPLEETFPGHLSACWHSARAAELIHG